MIVIATGFIPLAHLSVVPTIWESRQWLGKNIVRSIDWKQLQESMDRCTDRWYNWNTVEHGVKHHTINQSIWMWLNNPASALTETGNTSFLFFCKFKGRLFPNQEILTLQNYVLRTFNIRSMCVQNFNTNEAKLRRVGDTKLLVFWTHTDTRTEKWTNGRTDSLMPVYPRKHLFFAGIKKYRPGSDCSAWYSKDHCPSSFILFLGKMEIMDPKLFGMKH